MRGLLLILGLCICLVPVTSSALVINEWVANDIGGDDYQFVELCGTPGESLDGLSLVLIEGELTGKGVIDLALDLTGYAVDGTGFFVIGDANVSPDLEMTTSWIENGGNTILLVADVQQAVGTDIDTDDDCVEDLPIGTVLDGVGYGFGYSADDCASYYGAVPLGPDVVGGNEYDPAGAARCDDCTGDWYLICLDGTEPTGSGCSEPEYLVASASPGGPNNCYDPTSVDENSWGSMKAMYK